MNFIWHASPRLCLPDFDTFEKKLEEKARKPCKNSGWLGKLLKTCCNRIMSHFYYRLLLIDDVESIWEESAARNHTLFRTGGSTFSEMPRLFRAYYPNSTKSWGYLTAPFIPPIAAKKRWSTGRCMCVEDSVTGSIERLRLYGKLDTAKVDVSKMTPEQAAEYIIHNCWIPIIIKELVNGRILFGYR